MTNQGGGGVLSLSPQPHRSRRTDLNGIFWRDPPEMVSNHHHFSSPTSYILHRFPHPHFQIPKLWPPRFLSPDGDDNSIFRRRRLCRHRRGHQDGDPVIGFRRILHHNDDDDDEGRILMKCFSCVCGCDREKDVLWMKCLIVILSQSRSLVRSSRR